MKQNISDTVLSDTTALTQNFHYESDTHVFDIKWRELGDPSNPPVIFVHGTPWSSRVWIPNALALSNRYRVYLFDNPGFGESPLEHPVPGKHFKPADRISELDSNLARQSKAYAVLFKYWEPEWRGQKPHVIAHDHAGLMSLRAFLLHGCQYASLCLIDVVAIGPFGQALFKTVAENPELFKNLPNMAFEGIVESYIRNAAHTILSDEVMQLLKKPWLSEEGKAGFIRQLCQADSRSTMEVEGRYGEVGDNMPVKIIWGENDNWLPVETAERLGRALGAKEIVYIADAGHLVMYDQPAQLGIELGSWLSSMSN